jgi:hypothetical protein
MSSERKVVRLMKTVRSPLALAVVVASLGGTEICRADTPAAGSGTGTTTATAAPTDDVMVEARKQFQAGVNLLDDPDGARYEDAYLAFRKAYELSRSPKVLGNIGFCALKLERDGEAIDAYSAYLRETRDIDERERAQIERDLATLNSSAARFRVLVKKRGSTAVVVDTRLQTRGTPVVNTYPFQGGETTLRMRPGRHSIKVKIDDVESIAYETTIEPSSSGAHDFTFAPPLTTVYARDYSRSPSYVGPILLGAVGLAGIGTGVVTGLMAKNKTSAIEARCPGDLCPSTYDFRSDRSEAKSLGTVADVAFVGGGVALGGALLWALLTPRSSAPKPPQTGSTAWVSGAQCTARGCDVQVGGSF